MGGETIRNVAYLWYRVVDVSKGHNYLKMIGEEDSTYGRNVVPYKVININGGCAYHRLSERPGQ
ncbi:hypothetical protein GcM1_250013 [Golovinomyces cichoracearum]|uniref:Uncharacterized protein n=1 Tax=Golovinomyces cichoracearum TaxID=62708 RepID=A0A420IAN7_9PEZI|nr:hypothetical protein GcM1_250013 [Golovinomyces cichoracearum]